MEEICKNCKYCQRSITDLLDICLYYPPSSTGIPAVNPNHFCSKFADKHPKLDPILYEPVEILNFTPARIRNVLRAEKINYIGELVQCTFKQLWGFTNFGKRSVQEIREVLASKGLVIETKLEGYCAPTATPGKEKNDE